MTDIAQGIREAAAALGMDPVWLATYISYETGGTFDPVKAGPTTKWGQHKGLIQFGEPQALQYGVNWDDPVGSQLGASGAIVKYFRDRGWREGMSFLDGYSIINAGGPGRYSATDAHAGGAQGTVADKVAGMEPHLLKASALLGGELTPEQRNGLLSASFSGQTASSDAAAASAAAAVAAPEATASSDRDRQRGPKQSPFYEALRVSYADVPTDLLSDPTRDGIFQPSLRR